MKLPFLYMIRDLQEALTLQQRNCLLFYLARVRRSPRATLLDKAVNPEVKDDELLAWRPILSRQHDSHNGKIAKCRMFREKNMSL